MWALYEKMEQEKQLKQLIADLGGSFPFHTSEETQRMEAEVDLAVEKNGRSTFMYSRGPGSGLRVPGYTDLSGAPLNSESNSGSESRTSPGLGQQNLTNGIHGIFHIYSPRCHDRLLITKVQVL